MVVNSCFEDLEGRVGLNRVWELVPKVGVHKGSGGMNGWGFCGCGLCGWKQRRGGAIF